MLKLTLSRRYPQKGKVTLEMSETKRKERQQIKENLSQKVTGSKLGASKDFSLRNHGYNLQHY